MRLQGCENMIPGLTQGYHLFREEPEEVKTLVMDQIEVKSYVGGLVKSFERKAA